MLPEYKPLIATPCYGGQITAQYMMSCINLLKHTNAEVTTIDFQFLSNESLITRGRNKLANDFLKSDHTHLIFIDADIEFPWQAVKEVLSADLDIVGAAYTRKVINWGSVIKAIAFDPTCAPNILEQVAGDFVLSLEDPNKPFSVGEPVEVQYLGTGFMCIKRQVLLDLIAKKGNDLKFLDNRTDNNEIYGFFETAKDKDNYHLSEDYAFCQLVREIGYKVHLLPWIELNHIGTHTYTGSIPMMARLESAINKK